MRPSSNVVAIFSLTGFCQYYPDPAPNAVNPAIVSLCTTNNAPPPPYTVCSSGSVCGQVLTGSINYKWIYIGADEMFALVLEKRAGSGLRWVNFQSSGIQVVYSNY